VHRTAQACLADNLGLTSEVITQQHLCSVDTTMLLVPLTSQSTDHAFPMASAQAQNGLLPTHPRATSSSLTFQ